MSKSTVDVYTTSAYSSLLKGYDDYLDLNFDEATNSIIILGKIHLSGKINIEIYTLKEIMQYPDRAHSEKDFFEEVKAMFVNNIWFKVYRKIMYQYYDSVRKSEYDIKRHCIMIIWSFKRKSYPYSRLIKYKVVLCCVVLSWYTIKMGCRVLGNLLSCGIMDGSKNITCTITDS